MSKARCTAVGLGSGPHALVERYDGRRWSFQMTPSSPDVPSRELRGVSCTSRSFCAATGSYLFPGARAKPLAEVWDGEGWSVRLPPLPPDASNGGLFGISCVRERACIAVGVTHAGGQAHTLAETYS